MQRAEQLRLIALIEAQGYRFAPGYNCAGCAFNVTGNCDRDSTRIKLWAVLPIGVPCPTLQDYDPCRHWVHDPRFAYPED
jgi:hypothetical protein